MHRDETGSKVVLAEGSYCSKDLPLAQTYDRHISYIYSLGIFSFKKKNTKEQMTEKVS